MRTAFWSKTTTTIRPVDISRALARLGYEAINSYDDVYVRCPNEASHDKKSDKPTLRVKGESVDGYFKCWDCDYHGTFLELVQDTLGINQMDAWEWIQKNGPYREKLTEEATFPPGSDETEKPYRLISLAELQSLPVPAFLVDGMIEIGAVGMLYGTWGTGKSFLMLDLCFHVATGEPWFGREVRQGKALYVSAEGGVGQRRRVEAWQQQHGRVSGDFDFIIDPVQLGDADTVSALCADIKAGDYYLVVIDTMARSTVGIEENSAKEMGVIVDNMMKIRDAAEDAGTTVLGVAHCGNNSKFRGSSAVPAAMDFLLRLENVTEHTPVDGMILVHEKSKNCENAPPVNMRLATLDCKDEYGEFRGGYVEQADDVMDVGSAPGRLAYLLKAATGPLSVKDMEKATGLAQSTISTQCEAWHAQGTVSRTGKGARGSPYLYAWAGGE